MPTGKDSRKFIEKSENSRLANETYPFEVGYLPEAFQKKAEMELRDTPENQEKGFRLLREMAKKDKHFNGLTFDDEFLLQFLRCKKYNVAKAFSQLKAFVNLRRRNDGMFNNFNFENLCVTLKDKVVTFLPWRCTDGCAILYAQLDNWNPDEFPLEDLKRTLVLFLLQSLRDPMTNVNGFKVILDVKSNPLRHLRYMTPSNLYLLYHGTQECVPGRFKEIHIVNNSLAFKAAWLLIKRFLTDKLRKRFYFHSDHETLLNFYPRSILPVELGGDLEDYDMTYWLRKVLKPENLATLGGGNPFTD